MGPTLLEGYYNVTRQISRFWTNLLSFRNHQQRETFKTVAEKFVDF
jgi:hypothetical protein